MTAASVSDGIAAIQEAEWSVKSSIVVREQYKTKLRQLVDALLPPSATSSTDTSGVFVSRAAKSTTNASKKKQNRDAIADRLRVRATMPTGKELQVVGDWLLLLRAASVNVVESITHWRKVVHHNRPLPYEIDHANYLLQMVHDTDFLDGCNDLVAWLGFRLTRNPFIVPGGLDGDSKASANPPVSTMIMSGSRRQKRKSDTQPSQLLVKPLVSITPDDDVVDGTRITNAHHVLLDEEALYGKKRVFEIAHAYILKPVEWPQAFVDKRDDLDPSEHLGRVRATVFHEIAAVTKALRRSEHQRICLQRDRERSANLITMIEDQILATTNSCDSDLTSDHRVWQHRNTCRESTLRSSRKLLAELQLRVKVLDDGITRMGQIISNHQQRLDELVAHKERARRQRQQEATCAEADEIACRNAAIRRKTHERNRLLKVKRLKRMAIDEETVTLPPAIHGEAADHIFVEITTTLGAPASLIDRRIELDQKRNANFERRQREQLLQQQAQSAESSDLNRRRNENAQMYLEDRRSQMLESRWRLLIRERQRKERVNKMAAIPICSIVQTIGGVSGSSGEKTFVITVYQNHARGYAPEGLRFVAYDPLTSTTLSMLISTREYNSLGYGRTLEGLTSFCQWLCVIYEKRKRQFKLIWSGSPCPPPLRLRDYDHALVCVHKEGVRLPYIQSSHPSPVCFAIVSVFIRMNDPSKLRFVIFPLGDQVDSVEYVLTGRHLLPTQSLVLRSEYDGGWLHAVWCHALFDDDIALSEAASNDGAAATRVYSGEMDDLEGGYRRRIHIYDVSATEYELRAVGEQTGAETTMVLLKHEVNPYRVRLPGSAFGDLLACIKLERGHAVKPEDDAVTLKATILPSWRACLARYVRALRMAKFGCKIDGIFHLVVVTLVHQKTEFRAHLLFELTALPDAAQRHSLRISLSQFLRCPDANRRLTANETIADDSIQRCVVCLDNYKDTTSTPVDDVYDTEHLRDNEHPEPCTSCYTTQRNRLAILRTLLSAGYLSSDTALGALYYATCTVCGAVPPPIAVVIPASGIRTVDNSLVSQYFACFDGTEGSLENRGQEIRSTLETSRICVVLVASSIIATHSNAVYVSEQMKRVLSVDQHGGWPITVAVIYPPFDMFHLDTNHESSAHPSLTEALGNVAAAIRNVGDAMPVDFDVPENEGDGITNFEGYLVSEALLVEATRVILHPDVEWRLPGETVGASSWPTACDYLRSPANLSMNFTNHQARILNSNTHADQVLDAYTSHPKWPRCMEDVRVPFQPLLSCVLHIIYAQRLINLDGGLFVPNADFIAPSAVDFCAEDIHELEDGTRVIVIVPHPADSP